MRDVPQATEVLERIPVEDQQVGKLARRDRAQGIAHPQFAGGLPSGRMDHLEGR